jgi:hypothetical protein
VSAVGPYDEHLVRDVGAALLALGVLMIWAAAAPRAGLLRPAMVSTLVFAVPHLAYHLAAWEHMGVGDNIANAAVLALVVVVPAALLWTTRGQPGEGPRLGGAGGPPGGRLADLPAGDRGALMRDALALDRSRSVDPRLKDLGAARAALITGSQSLPEGEATGPLERLVLEYAEALSVTPSEISDDLLARLREQFDGGQLLELSSAIALESYRARLYGAVGTRSRAFTRC